MMRSAATWVLGLILLASTALAQQNSSQDYVNLGGGTWDWVKATAGRKTGAKVVLQSEGNQTYYLIRTGEQWIYRVRTDDPSIDSAEEQTLKDCVANQNGADIEITDDGSGPVVQSVTPH